MSTEVKRYDPINSDGTCGMCVEDADYGTYVEYADYAALSAKLECANQRARILLDAKNHWAERARKAEAELAAIKGQEVDGGN